METSNAGALPLGHAYSSAAPPASPLSCKKPWAPSAEIDQNAAGARTARGSRVREVEHRQGMALQSVLAQRGSPGRAPLHGAPAGGRRSLEASHSAFGRQRVRRGSSRWHMGGWPGKAIATPVLMLEHVVVLRWLLRTGLTAYAGGGGMVRHAVFLAGHVRVVSCGEHMSVDGICGLPE